MVFLKIDSPLCVGSNLELDGEEYGRNMFLVAEWPSMLTGFNLAPLKKVGGIGI